MYILLLLLLSLTYLYAGPEYPSLPIKQFTTTSKDYILLANFKKNHPAGKTFFGYKKKEKVPTKSVNFSTAMAFGEPKEVDQDRNAINAILIDGRQAGRTNSNIPIQASNTGGKVSRYIKYNMPILKTDRHRKQSGLYFMNFASNIQDYMKYNPIMNIDNDIKMEKFDALKQCGAEKKYSALQTTNNSFYYSINNIFQLEIFTQDMIVKSREKLSPIFFGDDNVQHVVDTKESFVDQYQVLEQLRPIFSKEYEPITIYRSVVDNGYDRLASIIDKDSVSYLNLDDSVGHTQPLKDLKGIDKHTIAGILILTEQHFTSLVFDDPKWYYRDSMVPVSECDPFLTFDKFKDILLDKDNKAVSIILRPVKKAVFKQKLFEHLLYLEEPVSDLNLIGSQENLLDTNSLNVYSNHFKLFHIFGKIEKQLDKYEKLDNGALLSKESRNKKEKHLHNNNELLEEKESSHIYQSPIHLSPALASVFNQQAKLLEQYKKNVPASRPYIEHVAYQTDRYLQFQNQPMYHPYPYYQHQQQSNENYRNTRDSSVNQQLDRQPIQTKFEYYPQPLRINEFKQNGGLYYQPQLNYYHDSQSHFEQEPIIKKSSKIIQDNRDQNAQKCKILRLFYFESQVGEDCFFHSFDHIYMYPVFDPTLKNIFRSKVFKNAYNSNPDNSLSSFDLNASGYLPLDAIDSISEIYPVGFKPIMIFNLLNLQSNDIPHAFTLFETLINPESFCWLDFTSAYLNKDKRIRTDKLKYIAGLMIQLNNHFVSLVYNGDNNWYYRDSKRKPSYNYLTYDQFQFLFLNPNNRNIIVLFKVKNVSAMPNIIKKALLRR